MRKTILIVDDFENTRWVVEFTLNTLKAEILKAEDGQDALKYFDGRNIDLVITDYNMPKLDGVGLVKEIRKLSAYEFIPIIMLTTETNREKKRLAEDVKVTAWVQKPFKQMDFLKIVNKCLRQT